MFPVIAGLVTERKSKYDPQSPEQSFRRGSDFRQNDRIEKGIAGHTSTSLSNQARNDRIEEGVARNAPTGNHVSRRR
ncbi:hypothetical protein FACS189434_06090 [Bacteroidia bacterium]|nr:hypothetical protein FACS189434_06090 [Bacteroidia bacterium]